MENSVMSLSIRWTVGPQGDLCLEVFIVQKQDFGIYSVLKFRKEHTDRLILMKLPLRALYSGRGCRNPELSPSWIYTFLM